jgi:DNA-directed RNA polymerase specialized sigma24 family protein
MEEISKHTGLSEEAVRRFLDYGPGPRVFGNRADNLDLEAEEEGNVVDGKPSAEEQLLRREFSSMFMACLCQFDSEDRLLIIKHYCDGQSFPELSRSMCKGSEAIRSRCRRAIKSLRQMMLHHYDDVQDFLETPPSF